MGISARVTSKGQMTIPKAIRETLGITEGDNVVFRVDRQRDVLAWIPDLLDLAGSVELPAGRRRVPWDEVHRSTRQTRAETRR